ncbi:MAG: 2-hydroxychromene-2-carboxylate isomerase [Rhodobacter sp.]|nr:2-hydroxychromene-2-carboxylate isomerase [Rhodobacter sp.]
MQVFDFYYDFGSPNAYLVHKVLPGIEARTGARARYCPMLLGGVFKATGNISPAFAGVKGKLDYLRREMDRFVNRHDVPFVWSPHFPILTIHLMRGAVFAQSQPWERAYIDAVFKACWVSGDNMSEPEVIARELAAEDLPAAAIMAATRDDAIKAALFEATAAAVARGVFGAPTMFVGEEMFFGKDSLAEFEAELVAREG